MGSINGSAGPDHDVIIVGGGPVGLTLGLLLHAFGLKATILERHATHYPQPRAVGIFHQAVQVYDALGLHDRLFEGAFGHPDESAFEGQSQLIGVNGDPVVTRAFSGKLKNGNDKSFSLHQPTLEKVLESACESRNIPVVRSTEVLDVEHQDKRVLVRASGPAGNRALSARFVVGCDGAKSIVRQSAGISFVDSGGIRSRWIVIDVTPRTLEDAQQWKDAFSAKQYMDWRRPHTAVPSPLKRRRWEFMLFPEENEDEARDPKFIFNLLAKFGVTPENARIERSAVYTLVGGWAGTFTKDHTILAGDAAHTTPPFLGQGLNSGIRDATNLAWRLDFALRHPDKNYQRLFQEFSDEQLGTTRKMVMAAIGLERLFCVTDQGQALARDRMLMNSPPPPLPDLEGFDKPGMFIPAAAGMFHKDEGPGHHFVDDIVQIGNVEGRLFELVKPGWVILQAEGTADNDLDAIPEATMQRFDRLWRASRLVIGKGDFRDSKGSMSRFFKASSTVGVVLRPDHYVYAVVTETSELNALVQGLLQYAS